MQTGADDDIGRLLEGALALHRQGALAEAVTGYRRVLARAPKHFDAHNLAGLALRGLKHYAAALEHFDQAIALRPDHAEVWTNRGNALQNAGRPREAVASYDKALALDANLAQAHANRAVALSALQEYAAALTSADAALALAPRYAEAHNNRGIALRGLKRLDEAVASFDVAIAEKPDFAEARYNRAIALDDLKRYEEAIASYQAARRLSEAYAFVASNILHDRMHICDWRDFEAEVASLEAQVARGQPVSPFSVMALSNSLAVQRQAAATWTRFHFPANTVLGPIVKRPPAGKIRVGYFSMDFRYSALAVMAAGLFEAHDRARFEITAFSFGPDTGDPMRKRLEKAFDRFIDVATRSDLEIAALARDLNIDIAVDLAGHQKGSRTGIFAARAAPIQVSLLSYPTGADYIDYLVADPIAVPDRLRTCYGERIAWLPYLLPNDRARATDAHVPARAALGLPERGFVFCCFNGIYKVTPQTFASWMRILAAVPGSVLWLAARQPTARANLRAEAEAQGIASDRLVFADYLPAAEHLARQRAADLFLDTLPYNAHSTASDALWAGVPVLTCVGETIAARGSASLLTSMGLPELITTSWADYEALAVSLAHDPARLGDLRRRLVTNLATKPTFDIAGYTRALEEAYTAMIARYRADLPPADIRVR